MGERSDLLGRPNGCHNIHVVDSSVLPTIAPGPITFTVMANARRIAEEAVN
jgi:choline dehydrogenase-like flavoprotein